MGASFATMKASNRETARPLPVEIKSLEDAEYCLKILKLASKPGADATIKERGVRALEKLEFQGSVHQDPKVRIAAIAGLEVGIKNAKTLSEFDARLQRQLGVLSFLSTDSSSSVQAAADSSIEKLSSALGKLHLPDINVVRVRHGMLANWVHIKADLEKADAELLLKVIKTGREVCEDQKSGYAGNILEHEGLVSEDRGVQAVALESLVFYLTQIEIEVYGRRELEILGKLQFMAKSVESGVAQQKNHEQLEVVKEYVASANASERPIFMCPAEH
jgi:hypothetical protein